MKRRNPVTKLVLATAAALLAAFTFAPAAQTQAHPAHALDGFHVMQEVDGVAYLNIQADAHLAGSMVMIHADGADVAGTILVPGSNVVMAPASVSGEYVAHGPDILAKAAAKDPWDDTGSH